MPTEFELIAALTAELRPTDAVVGPGDDAAVVALAAGLHVLTSDLLVENVDFRRSYATPFDIGYKAAAVTLSDVASMGARPRYLTVDIGSPEASRSLFSQLGAGLQAACGPCACSVVGGDVSKSPVLLLSTTAIGRLKARPALRNGALPGDLLLVTGTLGDSAAGFRLFDVGLPGHPYLRARHLHPEPRVEAGARLAEAGLITSMLDISDGLFQDLDHICASSAVSAAVWPEHLPLSQQLSAFCLDQGLDSFDFACAGGEDFELLFTAAESNLISIQHTLEGIVAVHAIGEIQQARPAGAPSIQVLSDGRDVTAEAPWKARFQGWDHFRDAAESL
jgi:thiamine-monophosphate kinase